MTYISLLKKVFFINAFLFICHVLPAQVMWNLKGGIMPVSVQHFNEDSEHKLNWMAGLEIEIPLSQKFNLETGLRYKNEKMCRGYSFEENHIESHLELPIRLTYKYRLRENLSLRIGIGTYLGVGLPGEGISPKVGVEPSVAVDWKCLSLGLTYNKPYYFAEREKYNTNSGLMLTVGVRFGTNKMKYVGAGLLTAGAIAGTIVAATQGNDPGSSYIPSSSYSSSSISSTCKFSNDSDSSSSDSEYYLREYQRFESLARDHYNTLTNLGGYKVKKDGKEVSGSNMQSLTQTNFLALNKLLLQAQKEMEKIRIEAAKKGVNIPKSEYEDVQVKWK